ncbi:MAG: hypothetical protein R3C53_21570 [Pirellulaceae bacterium]
MNSYSLDYIDDLYVQYVRDPASVSPGWRKYFEEFSLVNQSVLGDIRDSSLASDGNGRVALATTDDEPNAQACQFRTRRCGWRRCKIGSTTWYAVSSPRSFDGRSWIR